MKRYSVINGKAEAVRLAGTMVGVLADNDAFHFIKRAQDVYKRQKECRGLTILTIAHRESSLAYCHRVIRLNGKDLSLIHILSVKSRLRRHSICHRTARSLLPPDGNYSIFL